MLVSNTDATMNICIFTLFLFYDLYFDMNFKNGGLCVIFAAKYIQCVICTPLLSKCVWSANVSCIITCNIQLN